MNKFFASYDCVTANGKRKVDCWSDKNNTKPRDVALNCHNKFCFRCDVCPHEFEKVLYNVNRGSWCRYCAGQKLCDIEDCTHCVKRSFASYDGVTAKSKRKVDCWSDTNDKKPRDVALNCHNKFWFRCDVCPHEFEKVLYDVNKGSWCPYCAGQELCDIEDCTHCSKRSFASYNGVTAKSKRKVDCWSDKNDKKPRDVALNCTKKFGFCCDVCPHEFESKPNNVKAGSWCPYCAGRELCDKEDCAHCSKRSLQQATMA